MSPRRLLSLLVPILVSILPIAVSAQAPPATTLDWCPPSILRWSATFTLTGHGSLVWNGQQLVPGTADEKISGKINFVPINACSWQPSAFGFGDVSASVSITETDFSNPSCPVTFTDKGMGATGSGLTMGVADLIFLPTGVEGGPGLRFVLGRSTLDSAHATHGLTFQCTGFTVTNPIPFYVGPAHYNPILNFPLPAGGPQSFSVSTQFPADDQIGDPQLLWALTLNLTPVLCANLNIKPHADGALSLDGKPTTMNASFRPTDTNGSPMTLDDAAAACGFTRFDWVQTITQNRGGAYQYDPLALLTPPFLDPPSSGYTYDYSCITPPSKDVPLGYPPGCDPTGLRSQWLSMYLRNFANANPFYYSPSDILFSPPGCAIGFPPPLRPFCQLPPPSVINSWLQMGCQLPITSDASTLNFFDAPGNTDCSPPADCFKFTTELVGVCDHPSPACGNYVPGGPLYQPSAPLYQWMWSSNYKPLINRQCLGKGGVTASFFPPDPSSGTGGVTITSLHGVAQTPPSVSCMATPSTLWPPNGKPADVAVSGTVTAGTQTIPVQGTAYAVTDKYGLVQPRGSITIDARGNYSFKVSLVAARNGDDSDGRTYTINVIATDQIGNVGSCSAVVSVPHDQGN